MNGLPVHPKVRIIISKKLISSFRLYRTGWGLALGVNSEMG